MKGQCKNYMSEEQQNGEKENRNLIQDLHFELFRHARFNLLDGERVVRDLLDWRDLWYSVYPTRLPLVPPRPFDGKFHPYTELAMLRHIRWDSWPPDILYIWTNDEALPQLRQRIEERWEASEIGVMLPAEDPEMSYTNLDDEHDHVLFVWWD